MLLFIATEIFGVRKLTTRVCYVNQSNAHEHVKDASELRKISFVTGWCIFFSTDLTFSTLFVPHPTDSHSLAKLSDKHFRSRLDRRNESSTKNKFALVRILRILIVSLLDLWLTFRLVPCSLFRLGYWHDKYSAADNVVDGVIFLSSIIAV